MAVGKSSRPQKSFDNMLVGLGNITEKPIEEKINDVKEPIQENLPVKEVKPVDVSEKSKPVYDLDSIPLVNVMDKSNVGRPKVLTGVYKPISTRLKVENYEYARKIGGIYGGLTGYLNWLIEEDKKRRFKD